MIDILAALFASIGAALVITAILRPGSQIGTALRESGTAGYKLFRGSLGMTA